MAPAHRGFTLPELLTVIGIVVLLAAILIPVTLRARREGLKTRMTMDMQTVAAALQQYKSDFGELPRLPLRSSPQYQQVVPNTGAAALGKALVGPYGTTPPPNYDGSRDYRIGECVYDGSESYVCIAPAKAKPVNNDRFWALFDPRDGADGPGFRARPTVDSDGDGIPDSGGKTWGPYLQSGVLVVSGTVLLDRENSPILYFPIRAARQNLRDNQAKTPSGQTYPVYAGLHDLSYVNLNNNIEAFRRADETTTDAARDRLRMMLGDYNLNGYIDNGESPVEGSFILVSAGVDGLFGVVGTDPPNAANARENKIAQEKCDDIVLVQ
ncbi:type II secretion system protein [Fontivita pretiosa]|uniref:type II secretion system protein n=1 Tax=Fontivita pretiosa TaxID=2989684 RepID=UPI003D16DF73